LERSLPILSLGKKCIISGDKQQLQPTDFFQSSLKDEYEEVYDAEDEMCASGIDDIQDSESLLMYIEKKYRNIMLDYHYRSVKRELIQFSNVCFYDGKLVVANNPNDNQPGIEVFHVEKGK
jgi:superfamily I DNA and/or RNA helicase